MVLILLISLFILIRYELLLYLHFLANRPFAQLHLDVIRDTVCNLTLRTQENSLVPDDMQLSKHSLNVIERIAGEDWPAISITMIGRKR